MYFVGIDISKFKHDCAIIDELGDTVTPSRSFPNDREGFSHFKALLDSLEGEKKIGLESTGHYGQNLKQFLESNGFTFMEFNPLLVSRFVRFSAGFTLDTYAHVTTTAQREAAKKMDGVLGQRVP